MLKVDLNTYSRTYDDPGGPLVLMVEDEASAQSYIAAEDAPEAGSLGSRIGNILGFLLLLAVPLTFCLAR